MEEIQLLIIRALYYLKYFIEILITVRVLLSWVPGARNSENIIIKSIYGLTEPILGPIRNLIFKSPMGGSGMMLDFSPIIAYVAIEAIYNILRSIIAGL